jgi:protein-L-isoaspartate O-methyltransferase
VLNSIKSHGTIGLFEHYFQRKKLWSLKDENAPRAGDSSVSDSSAYLQIISSAVQNNESFAKFRSNREYRQILEHVSKSQGYEYLRESDLNTSKLKEMIAKVDFLNICGLPLVYYYPRLGFVSPTTLRYLKVFNELIRLFPNIAEMNIAEIGGGFGGQAAVLRKLSGFKSYTIYDLPEVHELQSRFLKANNSESGVLYADGRLAPSGKFDLVISNYAVSELQRELQVAYFENIVKSSTRGYLTWNLISQNRLGGLSVNDVLQYIPSATITEESPLTDEGNVLITWGA